MGSLITDVRRSLRSWRRTPGSLLLIVLALGLSGGALITLVSISNALFWRALPVLRPNQLVSVSGIDPRTPDYGSRDVPMPLFASLERASTVIGDLAGSERVTSAAVVVANTAQRWSIEGVTARYFDTLGLPPAAGHLIAGREVDEASAAAVISVPCWQTRFGSSPKVIGQTIRIQSTPVTIAGIASPGFVGLEVGGATDAWVPISFLTRVREEPADQIFLTAFGRLDRGSTIQQARSQIDGRWPAIRQEAAAAAPAAEREYVLRLQPRLESAAHGFSASGYRFFYRQPLALLILLSVMTVVLACANLSGLLLARWAGRETDLAVQAALGAPNARLVSQVCGDSLVLAVVAVVLSLPFALWSAKSLVRLLWNQPDVSSPLDITLDLRVVGVIVVVAVLAALCVSLLPACRIWTSKLVLARGTRGLSSRSVARSGRALVAVQIALAVPLLVSAWLVAANLYRLEGVNTGFRSDDVVVASLTRQGGNVALPDPASYFTALVSSLRAIPGMSDVALSLNEPLSFSADHRRRPVTAADTPLGARAFVMSVSPRFFDTLDVPLMNGRDFAWTDDGHHPDVAVVTAALAGELFPGADAVGRRIRLGGEADRLLEVIGVVADAKLAEPHATSQLLLFTALLQEPAHLLGISPPLVLFKSAFAAHALESSARRTVVSLGQHDLVEAHPLAHTLDAALLRERLTRLGGLYFAALTTLLVFVGLFAVLNLGVMRRIPEIGLRMALGASAGDIRATVLREAVVMAVSGLAVGLPVAFLAGRLLATSLTLVSPHDALAFVAATAVVLAVVIVSAWIPLRRATAVAPSEAMNRQ